MSGDNVHNRIAALRAQNGVTRREVAEALGVHYQTIGYLERGGYSPSLHLAIRIAEFFELPVEVVFSVGRSPSSPSTSARLELPAAASDRPAPPHTTGRLRPVHAPPDLVGRRHLTVSTPPASLVTPPVSDRSRT